jgi:hypothetical protein
MMRKAQAAGNSGEQLNTMDGQVNHRNDRQGGGQAARRTTNEFGDVADDDGGSFGDGFGGGGGGIGVCGKDGQSVPVGVGQPSLKIDELTVGGTQLNP